MAESQETELSSRENDRRWQILKSKVDEARIKDAFGLFRKNGIEPILIKGWAAAREYPPGIVRKFVDLDLSVAPGDFEKSRELVATDEGRRLLIDVHRGLRHLDVRDWTDLFANSRLVPLDGVDVRVLRPEDHLRILCVHWLNDGGADRDRLLDVFYLIQNNADGFEWERFLGGIGAVRREWLLTVLALTDKYFGLDFSGIPLARESIKIPRWVERALARERASGTGLRPLSTVLGDRTALWIQLKKRLPPNAIQATIEMEGGFYNRTPRLIYQLASFLKRVKPSLDRFYKVIRGVKD